jgi:AcrR family transcriptional regulator
MSEEKLKIDRRIIRTRLALRQTLMELIRKKGYDGISVEEIVQRANVGRATFYTHYRDKEDLLLDEFSELAHERVQVLAQVPFSVWLPGLEDGAQLSENKPSPPFLTVFQHVRENAELYRILLKNQSSNRIAGRIREIMTQSINQFVEEKQKNDPIPILFEVPVDLLAAYFNGALVSSIDWWLENMDKYPAEEMTRMFQRLFFPGARKIMGLPKNG